MDLFCDSRRRSQKVMLLCLNACRKKQLRDFPRFRGTMCNNFTFPHALPALAGPFSAVTLFSSTTSARRENWCLGRNNIPVGKRTHFREGSFVEKDLYLGKGDVTSVVNYYVVYISKYDKCMSPASITTRKKKTPARHPSQGHWASTPTSVDGNTRKYTGYSITYSTYESICSIHFAPFISALHRSSKSTGSWRGQRRPGRSPRPADDVMRSGLVEDVVSWAIVYEKTLEASTNIPSSSI